MIIDTNLLINSFKSSNQIVSNQKITSIVALEFLRNIEKKKNNCAKYYIPSEEMFGHSYDYIPHIDHPWNKRVADYIHFDFKNDYESYILYNNISITSALNSKRINVFKSSIEYLNKYQRKSLFRKFTYLLDNDIKCLSLSDDDIQFSYLLLEKFVEKYSLKKDFRNCWNDILIVSQTIKNKEELLSDDSLINRFLVEILNGSIDNKKTYSKYSFPVNAEMGKIKNRSESKNYINRGWQYKIKK